MPELPEVETVVRDLRPGLICRQIKTVFTGQNQLRRPWQKKWTNGLVATPITDVHRRGKWIIVQLQNDSALLLHLGMTGQLTLNDRADPVKDHTHLIFTMDGPQDLRFRDVRRFGSADFFKSRLELDAFLVARLGPEPTELQADYFDVAIRASKRCLKALLLDQSVVAGVGNIYADEANHRAGLHPSRRGNSLTLGECEALRQAIVVVIEKAIQGRGSTIRDYVGGSGLMGTYQNEFCVYGRTGEPCPRCGTLIERVVLAGRSSHYCPQCQPVPRGRTRGTRTRGER